MPTEKPRVSITFDADDLRILDRYAKASNTPRATIISGLIGSAIPELQKAAELIELANAAPRKIRQEMVDNLSNATADAMGFLAPFHRDYHTVLDALQYELSLEMPVRREGAGSKAAVRSPPPAPGRRKPGLDPRPLTGGSK